MGLVVLTLAGCGGGVGERQHAGLTESAARVKATDAVLEFLQSPDTRIQGFQLGLVALRVLKDRDGAEYWSVTAHDTHSRAAVCVRLTGGVFARVVVRACGSSDAAPTARGTHDIDLSGLARPTLPSF